MSGGGFQNRSELFHQLELTSIFFWAWKKDICELLRLLRKSSTLALYIFFPTLISSSVLFSSLWLTSLTRLGCLLIPPLILHCHPHVSSSILSENNAEEAWRRQPQRLKWLQKKKKRVELSGLDHIIKVQSSLWNMWCCEFWLFLIASTHSKAKGPDTGPHVQRSHAFDLHGYRLLTCADWPVLLWWPGINYHPHPLGFSSAACPRAVTYHHTPCI